MASTVTGTTIVGHYPLAIIHMSPYVYTSNYQDNTISQVDTRQSPPVVTSTLAVGAAPFGLIEVDASHICVLNAGSATVSIVSIAANGALAIQHTIGVGNGPQYGRVLNNHLYISNIADGTVSVISLSSMTVTNTISCGSQPYVQNSIGNSLFVGNLWGTTVRQIDDTSGTVVNTITVGSCPQFMIAMDTTLYVSCTADNTLWKIDTANGNATSSVSCGTNTYSMAAIGSTIYVISYADSTVSIINTTSMTKTGSYAVGGAPLAITADDQFLFVSNNADDTVSEIDTNTGAIITITVGDAPFASTTLGNYIYVANTHTQTGGFGTISQILVPTKSTATVTLSNLSHAWTGSALAPTIATSPAGLATRITYAGNHTDPGTYPFTVDISDAIYAGDASGTLTITMNMAAAPTAIATLNTTTVAGADALGAITQVALAPLQAAAASDPTQSATVQSAITSLTSAAFSAAASISTAAPALASTTKALMKGVSAASITLAASAASAAISAIQSVTSSALAPTLLASCAAINATKTNTSDANAISNAGALVTALQNTYSSSATVQITGSDITTLLTNTSISGDIPSSILITTADNTNTISLTDASSAYYTPMVPDASYAIITTLGQTIPSVIYSAATSSITIDSVSYSLGDTVPLGFLSATLFAVGSIGFTRVNRITLVKVTKLIVSQSNQVATASWFLPALGGVRLSAIRVVKIVNGTSTTVTLSSSATSYSVSGLSAGNTVQFAVSMIDTNGVSSSINTSNLITITGSSVPCFPKGTQILTPTGYKAVETLDEESPLILLADGRQVPFKLYGERFEVASERSAPYFIPKGALGVNRPFQDLTLSPDHAFLLRKGVWMLPRTAAKLSKKVQQIGVGEPIHYYHVECPNYLKDNLVTNGCIVESYAGKQLDFASPYTWSASLKGYTRRGEAAKSKAAHA